MFIARMRRGEKAWWRCSEAAAIARFTKKEYDAYEDSLKAYRDWVNTIKTAEKKAFQEGREKKCCPIYRLRPNQASCPSDKTGESVHWLNPSSPQSRNVPRVFSRTHPHIVHRILLYNASRKNPLGNSTILFQPPLALSYKSSLLP